MGGELCSRNMITHSPRAIKRKQGSQHTNICMLLLVYWLGRSYSRSPGYVAIYAIILSAPGTTRRWQLVHVFGGCVISYNSNESVPTQTLVSTYKSTGCYNPENQYQHLPSVITLLFSIFQQFPLMMDHLIHFHCDRHQHIYHHDNLRYQQKAKFIP